MKITVLVALILAIATGCSANVCSGNTINDQVDPPNDENNVVCGVVVE